MLTDDEAQQMISLQSKLKDSNPNAIFARGIYSNLPYNKQKPEFQNRIQTAEADQNQMKMQEMSNNSEITEYDGDKLNQEMNLRQKSLEFLCQSRSAEENPIIEDIKTRESRGLSFYSAKNSTSNRETILDIDAGKHMELPLSPRKLDYQEENLHNQNMQQLMFKDTSSLNTIKIAGDPGFNKTVKIKKDSKKVNNYYLCCFLKLIFGFMVLIVGIGELFYLLCQAAWFFSLQSFVSSKS